ncbi:hypothetical protein CUMW_158990 [Citrus unshiu]|uniref:Uncharacterized protein n=1 Tax=Citrus unshiu TaxID=55188 RepID=A0A2H5PQX1_CITUN|nr:hypothetical protein CUMW_158990 [Citrus unshiu]
MERYDIPVVGLRLGKDPYLLTNTIHMQAIMLDSFFNLVNVVPSYSLAFQLLQMPERTKTVEKFMKESNNDAEIAEKIRERGQENAME